MSSFEHAEYVLIPWEDIHEHPDMPNSRFDVRRELESLVESLRLNGQRTPVELWRPPNDTKLYKLSGFRRMEAMADIRSLPKDSDADSFEFVKASIFEGSLGDAMLRNIGENLDRQNLSPLECGRYFSLIMTEKQWNQQQLVLHTKRDRNFVSKAVNIYLASTGQETSAKSSIKEVTPKLKEVMENHSLSMDAAAAIARLPANEQDKFADKIKKSYDEDGEAEGRKTTTVVVKTLKKPGLRQLKEIDLLFSALLEFDATEYGESLNRLLRSASGFTRPGQVDFAKALTALAHRERVKTLWWVKNNVPDWSHVGMALDTKGEGGWTDILELPEGFEIDFDAAPFTATPEDSTTDQSNAHGDDSDSED